MSVLGLGRVLLHLPPPPLQLDGRVEEPEPDGPDAFSLMFPKSYRGIALSAGSPRPTMISWSMLWHEP